MSLPPTPLPQKPLATPGPLPEQHKQDLKKIINQMKNMPGFNPTQDMQKDFDTLITSIKTDDSEMYNALAQKYDNKVGNVINDAKFTNNIDSIFSQIITFISENTKDNPDLKKYYYNTIANIKIKNDTLDDNFAKHNLEIKYALNDIYIKDNKIDILQLLITGALLSLLTIAINKYLAFDLPVINIISIIVSIFVFLILIRVITNRNKKPLNFREFNYSTEPTNYGFLDKLFGLLYDEIPTFKLRKTDSTNNLIIPASGL